MLGPTNIFAVVEDPLRQVAEVVAVADIAADHLRHGVVAHDAMFVGDVDVGTERVGQHEEVPPLEQREMARVDLPGMRQHAERLVELEQVELDLILEQRRLAGHVRFEACLGLVALRARVAERAEPGQRDQRRGRRDDDEQPHHAADARPDQSATREGVICFPLNVRQRRAACRHRAAIYHRSGCISASCVGKQPLHALAWSRRAPALDALSIMGAPQAKSATCSEWPHLKRFAAVA